MSTRISLDQIEDGIPKEKLALVDPVSGSDPVTKQYLEDQEFVDGSITINGKAISTNPVLTKEDVGLGNLPNIPPSEFPISDDTQIVIDNLYKGPYALSRLSAINQTSFQDLISSYGSASQSIVLDRDINFTSTYNIPANINFIPSLGKINVASGVTVTINSNIEAGDQVLFTGLGNVVLAGNKSVNTRWWNILGDGVLDETDKLKSIIDYTGYKNIKIPQPVGNSYRFRKFTFTGLSDKVIEFGENTKIEGLNALTQFDHFFNFTNCTNIKIVGNRTSILNNRTAYPADQNRGGFKIMSCKKFTISEVEVKDSPGDGFYVGVGIYNTPCEDIVFDRCIADNVVRNGFSIISVKKLRGYDCVAKNSNGAAPMAGIDFEPNDSTEHLEDIQWINFTTENNGGAGVLVTPYKLSDLNKSIDITITNHRDNNSFHGAYVGEHIGKLDGKVIFKTPFWTNTYYGAFMAYNWSSLGPRVEIQEPITVNCNRAAFYTIRSVFGVFRRLPSANESIGNVHIIRPSIFDNRTPVESSISNFYFRDAVNILPVENCSVIDPVSIPSEAVAMLADEASVVISDKYNVFKKSYITTETLSKFSLPVTATNKGATSQVILTLPDYESNLKFIKEITFEVEAAQLFRCQLPSGHVFQSTNAVGTYLESNTIGSKLTLKKISLSQWVVIDITGAWKDSTGKVVGSFGTTGYITGTVISTTDANDLRTPGLYTLPFTLTTAPPNFPSRIAGVLKVEAAGGGATFVTQTFTCYAGGSIFVRSSTTTSVWTAWKKIPRTILFDFELTPITIPANSIVTRDFDPTTTGAVGPNMSNSVNRGTQVNGVTTNIDLGGIKPLTAIVLSPTLIRVFFENPTGSPIGPSILGRIRIVTEDVTP